MSNCSAILLAAGRSRRLGFDKILTPLAGRPVLQYALQALRESPSITELVLVTRRDLFAAIEDLVQKTPGVNPVKIIEGGAERQDSVFAGLQACAGEAQQILIHDAARPLLCEETIAEVLGVAREKGAAITAHRASDTLKEADESARVTRTLDRSKIWAMGTPQVFRSDWVREAYARVQAESVAITDDAAAVERLGHPVFLVETARLNLKITRPADWAMLELWLSGPRGVRVRQLVHLLSNQISPMTGYLPLLKKYGGADPKFLEYIGKMEQAAGGVQSHLHELQQLARELFPDSPAPVPRDS